MKKNFTKNCQMLPADDRPNDSEVLSSAAPFGEKRVLITLIRTSPTPIVKCNASVIILKITVLRLSYRENQSNAFILDLQTFIVKCIMHFYSDYPLMVLGNVLYVGYQYCDNSPMDKLIIVF